MLNNSLALSILLLYSMNGSLLYSLPLAFFFASESVSSGCAPSGVITRGYEVSVSAVDGIVSASESAGFSGNS